MCFGQNIIKQRSCLWWDNVQTGEAGVRTEPLVAARIHMWEEKLSSHLASVVNHTTYLRCLTLLSVSPGLFNSYYVSFFCYTIIESVFLVCFLYFIYRVSWNINFLRIRTACFQFLTSYDLIPYLEVLFIKYFWLTIAS